MISIRPRGFLRLAMTAAVCTLGLQGCTQLLEQDPLNKTESIVKGTQVTRGPSRGTVSSGFADTIAPTGNSFEPAVGEPFDVEQLVGIGDNDVALPELGGIDFGAERSYVEQGALGLSPSDAGSTSFFLSDIGQTIYFATDSSELDERARETLRRQAAWLNVNTQARVTVEGHADERGTREYNLALGDRRASATRGYLIAVGIDEGRIDKTSFGKERPVALGSDTEAWSQNRRTETTIEGGEAFASNPVGGDVQGLDNLTITTTETFSSDSFGLDTVATPVTTDPFTADFSSDPTFPPADTITYGAPADTITYGQPVTTTYDSGTIAPTVFDTYSTPTTTTTSTTRIEDVSVDDLLRDPSLIDRIGSPGTTTTTTVN